MDIEATLTQLRDAAHTRGQERLLQGPQLQLGIGISSLVVAQGPTVVGTEVCREGKDTCREQGGEVTAGSWESSTEATAHMAGSGLVLLLTEQGQGCIT